MKLSSLACAIAGVSAAASKSLKDTLASHESLTILNGLLNQFDLIDDFDSAENVTLLAPTDQAYKNLAQWGFNVSEVDPFIAHALLTYHLLDGQYSTSAIAESDDQPQIVHSHLTPPSLTNVSSGAAVKLSTGDSGSGLTVESGLQVIGGTVEEDIVFDNGVLHTINGSLVLPHNISLSGVVGQLTGFLDLMAEADDVATMEGQADVTVFIPHNAALESLGPLLGMLTPRQLARVVENHAVTGRVLYRHQLEAEGGKYMTIQGGEVHVRTDSSGEIYVNDAKVVRSDLILYGGVAHIIDGVLVPETRKGSGDLQSGIEDAGSHVLELGVFATQTVGGSSWFNLSTSNILQLSALGAFFVACTTAMCMRRRRVSPQDGSSYKSTAVKKYFTV